MDRSNIKNLFLTGVVEALVRQCEHTKNCQENSKPSDRFHLYSRPGTRKCSSRLAHLDEGAAMICTKGFFCNIIVKTAKKQVCAIEHTFIFSPFIRGYERYQL